MQTSLLTMNSITKRFSGVLALNRVDFSVDPGEIHGLMGENGAGKSTLVKILTGIYRRDDGEIEFDGKILNTDAIGIQKAGISTIYQELNLIPYLSVAENIFLGREIKKKGKIDWKATYAKAEEIIKSFDIIVDVRRPVIELSAALQQITAIARAISVKAKLVVMDEPTSSLDNHEVDILMDVIRKLKKENISVLFISHRLNEILGICDRVTILRDGNKIGVFPVDELDHQKLVSLMIGREFNAVKSAAELVSADIPIILHTEHIASGMKVQDIGFTMRQGECVGMAGLLGSGRTEFANILFGVTNRYNGKIYIDGSEIKVKKPRDVIKRKFSYLSEDRKRDGIIPNMTIKENITLCMMPAISRFGIISSQKEKKIVNRYIEQLNIKTPHMDKKMRQLSGGNQQKVLLARWLATNPRFMILDEPTRGIDVGAKAEIESRIRELVKKGISVLMISSELNELINNCSRVEVLSDGVLVGDLQGSDVAEKNIIRLIASAGKEGSHHG
jgi:ABC-type sugar transport system ATPase subunit